MRESAVEFAEHYFYTPSALERKGGVYPLRMGRNIAKPDYRAGPKLIEYYSLHFVAEGMVRHNWEDGQAVLREGDVFCLFPHATHHYHVLPENPILRMYWFAFNGEQAADLLRQIGFTPARPFVRQAMNREVRTILEQMLNKIRSHAEQNQSAPFELASLVYHLFHALSLRQDDGPPPSGSAADWVERCKSYMELHFGEGIGVRDVVKYACVNRSHFSAAFTSRVGISPMRYLQKLRMTKASEMLKETDRTVTEIALSLGYPDLYSFTRAFSGYYGISPRKYRQRP